MIKYPDWVFQQSAVMPYRRRDGELEVMMITSRRKGRWVLPKGIVDPGLSPRESAAKEAREEAGVEGAVWERSVGDYEQDKWGGTCRIAVYPMQVTRELDEWPEAAIRTREWMTPKAARKRIDSDGLRTILKRLPDDITAHDDVDEQAMMATTIPSPRLLYLFRHAKSSWDDPSLIDFDRPLATRGRNACEAMSEYLRIASVRPEAILCSSSVRTRQTLAGIQEALGRDARTQFTRAIYEADYPALLSRLKQLPDETSTAMMIGHNPGMQDLALELIDDGDAAARARMAAKFPTAALAILVVNANRWQDLGSSSCRLHSFVVPRELV